MDKLLFFSNGSTNVKCNISAPIRPILMKFCMMMQLSPPKLTENQKLKKKSESKMADGGHLEYRKITISQKPFGRF